MEDRNYADRRESAAAVARQADQEFRRQCQLSGADPADVDGALAIINEHPPSGLLAPIRDGK